MTIQNGARALRGSACLEKAIACPESGPALVLVLVLVEVARHA